MLCSGPLVAIQDDLPEALRALRERSGLAQGDLRERGGPPVSTVSKLESGVRPPDFRTVANFLEALELSFHDLADELDSIGGRTPRQRPGQPQPTLVAGARHAIDLAVLRGMSYGVSGPREEADFVASVEAAAREAALAALREREPAPLDLVAEPEGIYSAPSTLRGTAAPGDSPRRGRS